MKLRVIHHTAFGDVYLNDSAHYEYEMCGFWRRKFLNWRISQIAKEAWLAGARLRCIKRFY